MQRPHKILNLELHIVPVVAVLTSSVGYAMFHSFADPRKYLEPASGAGAYLPVLLTRLGKSSGVEGGRSLTYVLGNMLSAGGAQLFLSILSHSAYLHGKWLPLTCSCKSMCRLPLQMLGQHGPARCWPARAVMVSAGFVHLLGAAIKELNPELRFPLASFLCGLGFLITLVADHVAEVLSHQNGWETPPGHCTGSTLDGEMTRLQHVLVVDPVTPRRTGASPLVYDSHSSRSRQAAFSTC